SVATTSPLGGGTITTSGTLTCTTCVTTTSGGALTATSPATISAGGLIAISGVTSEQGNGSALQLSTGTVNLNRVTKFDTNGNTINSDLLESSNLLSDATTTQTLTIVGGADASANSVLGSLILRGANQTGAGGATSQGGDILVTGGTNTATNAGSQGGSIMLLPGASTGAGTPGLQGINMTANVYIKAAPSTLWNLGCGTGVQL